MSPHDVMAEPNEMSKLLFGNRHRLSIASAIAGWESPVVTCREIAQRLGLPDSVVRPELLRFAAAGILVTLPRTEKSQQYERVPHIYWQMSLALLPNEAATVSTTGASHVLHPAG